MQRFNRLMARLCTVFCVGLSVFQVATIFFKLPTMQLRPLHLCFGMAVVFLMKPSRKERTWWSNAIDLLLAAAGLTVGIYSASNYLEIAFRAGNPQTADIVMGVALTLLVMEIARRTVGWVLVGMAVVALAYAFLGQYVPDLFAHRGFSLSRIATMMFMSSEGIYGTSIGISATVIFQFVLFGSLLQATGAGRFFVDFAMALLGTLRGGIAKVAVIASSLFGTISGSGSGNVVATGSITIPMMIATGYKRHEAGAVECVASLGGPLLPPMMAASAFLIPEFIGGEYRDVVIAAAVPAVLYFWSIFWMIDFQSARLGITGLPKSECPNLKATLREGWQYLAVIALIVYMLVVRRNTPTMAAAAGILAVIVVSLIKPGYGQKRSLKTYVGAFEKAAKSATIPISTTALSGIVLGVVTLTGIGVVFSSRILAVAGHSVVAIVLVSMVAAIFLGMGLPPIAAYIIVAVLVAPTMIEVGFLPMAAHLFVFWYGMFGLITPPVCGAVFASCGISEAKIWPTAREAIKSASVGYLIPLAFVFQPALLLYGTPPELIWMIVLYLVGSLAMVAGVQNYFMEPLILWERIALLVCGLICILPIQSLNPFAFGLILILFAYLIVKSKKTGKAQPPDVSEQQAG
ncbi:MAG: TRAP transporter fused permease subunit [Clostridiales Family XIII bacterium]|jgi:TRAP transporter 4TM/12TM fusion protein|nr:TRAP transporter fused permease subunit [Clostridiales Family XIII bacterium]